MSRQLVEVLFVLLILVVSFHCIIGDNFTFNCLGELDGRNINKFRNKGCIVANLSEDHFKDMDRLHFPEEEHIILYKPEVCTLTKEFFERMPSVKTLTVYGGVVLRLFLPVQLETLILYWCNTRVLDINEEDDYRLTELQLYETSFTAVPENINQLAALKHLYFDGNFFETLHMDHFNGLSNLDTFRLNSNRMRQIVTDRQVSLPSLRLFSVSNNSITALDVRNWKMPNLEVLYLWSNRLQYVVGLDRFAKLQELRLHDNELNCDWVLEAEQLLAKSNFSRGLLDRNPCTDDNSDRHLCCRGDKDDAAFLEYQRVKGTIPRKNSGRWSKLAKFITMSISLCDDVN